MVETLLIKNIIGLATIQDTGRYGYRSIGIPVSGALDKTSCVYSNLLINNDPREAVVEIYGYVELGALNNTIICVTGGSRQVLVNDTVYETWRPIYVEKGSRIIIQPGESPLSYLSMHSGIKCSRVLGSKSTYLRGSIGCIPRLLTVGDVLETYKIPDRDTWVNVKDNKPLFDPFETHIPRGNQVLELRATLGIHNDKLWDIDVLFRETYCLSNNYDRMGYRLEGKPLESTRTLGRLPSIPVDRGYVQIPPDGKPIVLMSESQTMGGYPVALHVLQPDVDRLAHVQPGFKLKFKEVSIDEAEYTISNYLNELENLQNSRN